MGTPSGSSHSAPKKIKEEIKPFIEATPTVVETYPDTEPTNEEEDYLEAEDPSEMGVESHQYDLDTEQGESMAYEGDPNNPGIIEPIILENGDSQCPLCQKIMRTKNYFESHIRTHTGEKPFACSACDYAASDRSNLRRHINSKH